MTTHDKVKTWKLRASLLGSVHQFFTEQGFTHLETPLLVTMPGYEVYLNYFQTDWYDLQRKPSKRWLRSSPEIHLKKAIAEGLDKVYEIGKCFRNVGELGPMHHPEFTMLEWYQTGIDFTDFMRQTEDFFVTTHAKFSKLHPSPLQLPKSFQTISMFEAFRDIAKVALVDGDPDLNAKARSAGHTYLFATDDFETSYFKILLNTIEPRLKEMGAVFVYDFPPSQAALAQVEDGCAKRFEAYIHGVELCNAFVELTSPSANDQRLVELAQKRKDVGGEPVALDEGFMTALNKGLPACCGNALGFDRWFALLLGDHDLNRALPFSSVPISNLP